MNREGLKTSEEWQEILKDEIKVLDPDGWNRDHRFQYEWYEERISYHDFYMKCMSSTCKNLIKYKKPKTWIIGDIHGEFIKLQNALEKANVDFENDRLIQLGDIMDRGINPFRCIDIIMKFKNRIIIKGNHDAEFLNMIATYEKFGTTNGGFGGHHGSDISILHWQMLSREEKDRYIEFFGEMRNYYIDETNRFYTHAGFNRHLLISDQEGTDLLFQWDRDFILAAKGYHDMNHDKTKYPFRIKNGFKEVFIGHTPTQYFNSTKPICCGNNNVWLLDTGAGKFSTEENGFVTVMDLETKEFYQG